MSFLNWVLAFVAVVFIISSVVSIIKILAHMGDDDL